MPASAFDDRRMEVLRTLIQLHIETGEPVEYGQPLFLIATD